MKTIQLIIASAAIIFATGCTKDKEVQPQSPNQAQQLIPIPNGDFENWNSLSLQNWKTNSCRLCTPPYETYIIKQDSDFYHGQFAAKFIYNNVYPAKAENKFSVPSHPSNLKAYVKFNLYGTDTVTYKINLFR